MSISETVSQKRGRPEHPLLAHWRPVVLALFPVLSTSRAVADRCWAQEAIREIVAAEKRGAWAHPWLWDTPRVKAGKQPTARWTVLAELGRLKWECGVAVMLDAAAHLDANATAREQVRYVRLVRRIFEAERKRS